MKPKVLLLAVGLIAAGVLVAVILFKERSTTVESSPNVIERELAAATASDAAGGLQYPPVTSGFRSEVAAPVIHGRVVEVDSGLGVAEVGVRLYSRGEALARAISDPQGRFELPFTTGDRIALQLEVPEGWKATRPFQQPSSAALAAEEIVFELRRSAQAFFRGRAIDALNGDPLPYLRLEVGPQNESVETDADGLFTTVEQFEAGDLVVALVNAAGARWLSSERSIANDGSTAIHDVPLSVGPTYELNVTVPPSYTLADLRAFLAESSHDCPWTLTDDFREREGEPVHLSSPPWVRFLRVGYVPEGDLATLWICTVDGQWLGSCKVPPISSRVSGTHAISLAPCGSIEVTLRGKDGRPVPSVGVALRRPGGEECGLTHWTESSGQYAIRLVPPGDYVLSVEGNRTKTIERTVRVAAGEPTVVEPEVEFLEGGFVKGVVRTQSGQYQAIDLVRLNALRRKAEDFTAEVQWTNVGSELVGRFTFEGVPAGEYELSPVGSSNFDWRASVARVSPPAADVELLCLDGAGGIRLEVEAFDARTGKPVRELAVYVNREGVRRPDSYSANNNRLQLGRFPRDVALEWGAVSVGYVARGGDLTSFEPVGTAEGEPLLRARLELQPGWGGRVLAYTKTERIAGAVVLCDGIEVGRTNERGEFELVLPARPKTFEIRHPGFVMQTPATGEVPEDAAVLLAYMKPRE